MSEDKKSGETSNPESCPFCSYKALRNKSFEVAWEPFPINIGHMKIIPIRHDAEINSLTQEEQIDFFDILSATMNYLNTSLGGHKPNGFNIGINIGEAAGQTIKHLHIHVIPRYTGDVENPRGGVRNIKEALIKW